MRCLPILLALALSACAPLPAVGDLAALPPTDAGIISGNASALAEPRSGAAPSTAPVLQGVVYAPGAVEKPQAGMAVRLLAADGTPVTLDGLPATTTTDANGRYAFKGALPAHTLRLAAGNLEALVPQGRANVDVDLVAGLAARFVLDRYAKGDAAVLDRVTEPLERATREAIAASVAQGNELPTSADPAFLDALRLNDKTLDDRLRALAAALSP